MPNSSTFLHIENQAHGGAFGHNPTPTPTEAQCRAGNYKMGRVTLYGLNIAIEQPRGTYRTGTDSKTGKRWTNRMAAHYGYFSGTVGNDGDGVDCFVGFYPQSEFAYVINQNMGGRFDETKVMLAFPSEETARRAYTDSYNRGWPGLASIVPASISQLKWWLKHGDMTRPLKSDHLPHEGIEAMTIRSTQWNADALPYDQTLDQLLYDIRRSDSDSLLLDSASIAAILEDSDGALAFDALVVPFAALERRMGVMQRVMERHAQMVKPLTMQVTEPFMQRGVANVAAFWELTDGQTISIYFHNPDVTPKKIMGTDEVISWKWLLNKKDITIVVAPERGTDLNINEVARRIMKLAEKNSAAFQRANGKRAERLAAIGGLKTEISALEAELKTALSDLEAAKVEQEDLVAKASAVPVIDPMTPEGYAKVMADPVLQEKYQDVLDDFFTMRINATLGAIAAHGFEMRLTVYDKVDGSGNGFSGEATYKKIGAGKNVVSATYTLDKTTSVSNFPSSGASIKRGQIVSITDDLTKTPAELAAQINAAAVPDVPVPLATGGGDKPENYAWAEKDIGYAPNRAKDKFYRLVSKTDSAIAAAFGALPKHSDMVQYFATPEDAGIWANANGYVFGLSPYVQAATKEKAKKLFAEAMSRNDGNKAFVELGLVSKNVAEKIKDVTGLDVSGYMHSVDESAIRHIIKQHGDAEIEAGRNQVAVTERDIENIPEIVAYPDSIEGGDATSDGLATIIFKKKIDDVNVYVQEVRVGRKKLAAKTLWKALSVPPAATDVGEAHTPETSGRDPSTEKQNVPAPADAVNPEGRESKVKTAKGTEVVTGFSVVEADRLITSHDPATGDVNPEFPQELQPRDRGRDTSRAWVLKTAGSLDPEQLGKTRRADTGAPIVGSDRVVESGNGRTMAIIEAYRIGKADEYRDWLESEADYFGLSAEKIKAMKRPVLVRVRTSEINRAEFAVEANQDDKLAMTATEKARADANRLTDDMIALMTDNGDLNAVANTAFLSAFLRSLGDAEAAQYSTSEGKPTSSLIARVQAAIFAKAYNDDRLLELTADSAKPEIANIISALNFAAPEFIQSAALDPVAASGATKKLTDSIETSLNAQAVSAIIGATNVIKQAKESGMQVDEFVKQQGLFGDLDPSVAAMAVFIAKNNRSAKRMGAAFKAMATFVKGEIERRQTTDMFGEPVPIGFPEIIAAANRELDRMFGEGAFSIETVDLFARRAEPVNTTIELTGKELGDFPDTPEGKKALREAAKENLNLLVGKWIPCPALGGDVEIRKKGIKEFISRSADTRKLKVAAAIESLILTSKKLATRSPYDGDVDKSALAYHTMRAEFMLEGELLAARLVIKEDVNGVFHYDLTVHTEEAVFDSAKENGRNELQPSSMTTSNGGGAAHESARPSRLASHQLDSTIAQSGTVFNLFIEGEAREVVADDEAEQVPDAALPKDIEEADMQRRTDVLAVRIKGMSDASVSLLAAKMGQHNAQKKSRDQHLTFIFDSHPDDIEAALIDSWGAQDGPVANPDAAISPIGAHAANQPPTPAVLTKVSKKDAAALFSGMAKSEADARISPDKNAFSDFLASSKETIFQDLLNKRATKDSLSEAQEDQFFDLRRERQDAVIASDNYKKLQQSEASATGQAPSPASTEAPQMTADKALFQSVIDNTVPDILAMELGDQLEAAYYRHVGNAEMEALFEAAVNAYTEAELAASANL